MSTPGGNNVVTSTRLPPTLRTISARGNTLATTLIFCEVWVGPQKIVPAAVTSTSTTASHFQAGPYGLLMATRAQSGELGNMSFRMKPHAGRHLILLVAQGFVGKLLEAAAATAYQVAVAAIPVAQRASNISAYREY